MLEEYLQNIGLSKNEARVYLALLKLGPQPVSTIANALKRNRSTTYSFLNKLEKKALISTRRISNAKFYSPNDPNTLMAYIDDKCKTLEYFKSKLAHFIPKLRALNDGLHFDKPIVSYYDGQEGLKHVMYDALKLKGEFMTYLPLHKWFNSPMLNFLPEYRTLRISDRKIRMRGIVPDTEKVRAFFKKYYDRMCKYTEILYVDDQEYWNVFESQMNIYDNKVTILHLDPGYEFGIILESKEIAQMQKQIFEMCWRGFLKS